jgi:SpoVK/Ycf46/Vps4 family AAA+-type ATPase
VSSPLLRLFASRRARGAIDSLVPRRTFRDVVLPPSTRRALDEALLQVHTRELIFDDWGLGERHPTGTALAFNFAGPSGTGKTICAEAIANTLGKRLMVVRYAELESMWIGETPKNVAAVFRLAEEDNAVLFFDEADAIAARRSTDVSQGSQREANLVVNVLLQELERFNGVVIFATNLAVNFDPAFERRIRTHVLFEYPGAEERELIWFVQVHPQLTPLAADVDFRALAERFEVSGGDIRNAVLKAALAAAGEPGPDADKHIHQRHFISAMEDVLAGKRVMRQSIMHAGAADDGAATAGAAGAGNLPDADENDPRRMLARLSSGADALSAAAQARVIAIGAAGTAALALLLALLLLLSS